MKRLVYLLLFTCFVSHADYKRLTDYQNILYQLIDTYVTENATNSSAAVLEFIYSPATKTVFKDAHDSGYTRKDLVFGTYQSSFGVAKPNRIIIKALHDAVAKENVSYDAAFYSSFITLGSVSALLLGLTRYFWIYFKYDKPAIEYYRANHHKYTIGNSIATNTNATVTTSLLEPVTPSGGTATREFWQNQ
jgi:hypothetical protein